MQVVSYLFIDYILYSMLMSKLTLIRVQSVKPHIIKDPLRIAIHKKAIKEYDSLTAFIGFIIGLSLVVEIFDYTEIHALCCVFTGLLLIQEFNILRIVYKSNFH